ncbi:MAG: phytanoyl-CoA dioxygenase family protein [Caldilineaceae bacterium]|nr:phytanoyl-CoA dioxygenase family protein [Caldilineaceae bacterium]
MTQSSMVVRPLILTDNELYFYQEYGYLTIPGFLAPDVVADLREQVLDVLAANGIARAQLDQANDTADKLRQNPQYVAGSLLDGLINGPNTLAIASQLIGGRAVRYLPFTAVKAGGGGGQFHFHQDNNYTQHDPALGSINIWVALVDMTPENGCLQMVPGSHKEGVLEWENAGDGDTHRKVKLDPKTFLPIRMRAGDAVAFTRLTVHGSGPNYTNQARVAYGLQYHREDVKYFDIRDEAWKLLIDNRRFQTEPVAHLGPQ